ncbi:MAG: HAMP domain-containing protein [Anaerolineales bacterium]|nr:HAMP domain-containing protein [Anaerolineales bacterium]
MQRLLAHLTGGQLRAVLIASFSLVAMLTVGVNTWVTSRVISDYLITAQDARVARDMNLAESFYQLQLEEVLAVGQRMSQDPRVIQHFPAALEGQSNAVETIEVEMNRKVTVPTLGGTHLVMVLDAEGCIMSSRVLSSGEHLAERMKGGSWSQLPIIGEVLSSGIEQSGTEIIPVDLLTEVGLGEKASIPVIETPLAAPELFDPREGTAGLALVGVFPLKDVQQQTIGAVVAAYLFNNDNTLVDRIKEVAGVDTATIFFGDLRVSTNVMTESGERAVGTRVSQVVFDKVLKEGQDYKGEAFVVNESFITRYKPLRDHRGEVVGILYVGARLSSFEKLVRTFYQREALIAFVCILFAGIVSVPIARIITRPIGELVEANRKLAEGDMEIRVKTTGSGELAALGQSFNSMVERLRRTQQELMHKEKLASMGQLAAGVAHELNNPLGTILLYSDVMYKEAAVDDSQRDDLDMIIKEATRCKNIVADLLNFARQQEVLAEETDVHELLEQVIEVLTLKPVFQEVEIVRRFTVHLPSIYADSAQLQQVFINVMNNAAEAMEGGGTILVATRQIDGDQVEVKISDTGSGIPEENLEKLFTPFFTTKAHAKGTGLGLSIVYGIIRMHGGQIFVESEVNKGTTFTILLPVRYSKGISPTVITSPDWIE